MDFVDLLIFALGACSGWLARRPRVEIKEITRSIAQHHGPERVYVRFTYLDGRVEVKPFLPSDLDLELEWKNRTFTAGEWTEDGQIYNEVLS